MVVSEQRTGMPIACYRRSKCPKIQSFCPVAQSTACEGDIGLFNVSLWDLKFWDNNIAGV